MIKSKMIQTSYGLNLKYLIFFKAKAVRLEINNKKTAHNL